MEFLVLLLLLTLTLVLGSVRQNVTFYTRPSCLASEGAGEGQAIIFNRYDSDSRDSFIAVIPNARSARIFGLWWFIVEDARTDAGLFGWTFNGGSDVEPACNEGSIFELLQPGNALESDPLNPQLKYIMLDRLGPSELDGAPTLTLYSESNFRGTPREAIFDAGGGTESNSDLERLEVENQGQSLEEPILVKSLVFSPGARGLDGLKGWTLYSGAEYTGIAYHVTVDDEEGMEASSSAGGGSLYFISAIDGDDVDNGITIWSIRPGIHFDTPVSEGDAAVMGVRNLVAEGGRRRQAGTPVKKLIRTLNEGADSCPTFPGAPRVHFGVSDRLLLSVAVAVAVLVFLASVAVVGLVFYIRGGRGHRDLRRGPGKRGKGVSKELLITPSQSINEGR